jgi:hypothetical protein
MEELNAYINQVIPGISQSWYPNSLANLAILNPPREVFPNNNVICKSDMSFIWLSWFVETVYDYNLAKDDISYAAVFSYVRRGLVHSGFSETSGDFTEVSKSVSRLVYAYIGNIKGRKRKQPKIATKEALLERSQSSPICWICGYRFKPEAIKRYLGDDSDFILPDTFDYFSARGLKERDISIEIEHKQPFSSGGADIDDLDNIDLSCGFCNKHKWKFLSIYDANRGLRSFQHPNLGLVSIPQPYWVIRILALAEKCSTEGCTAKKSKQQLYIDLVNPLGSASPTNLKVVCRKHLNNLGSRFVDRETFEVGIKRNRNSIV